MEGPAMDESRVRKRQRVGIFLASDELDFSVAFPFSDVKLVSASGDVLYGSRYNLAVRSPVCKQMLLSGMKEAQPLAMPDPFPRMRTEALQVLLDFCTFGCFSEKRMREAPVDVLHAARYFQLADDMEEVIGSVVKTLSGVGSEVDGKLAETLSLALECLPVDSEETYFFQLLLKKIFSRPIFRLAYRKLSSQALEFLLSKTLELQCSEPWASSFPFYSTEYSIFIYVLRRSGHHLSEDGQLRLLVKLYNQTPEDETFDIDKCAPESAEALESVAAIARPFLSLIDFRLIHPEQIADDIEPLKVVPVEMLFAALCHHARAPNLNIAAILYRGPYILQWSPDACGSGFVIDELSADGRELYCESTTTGFARTNSGFNSGEHSWSVTVSHSPNPGGIGIGFCSDSEQDYSKCLGYSSEGWILDGSGRLWQNGRSMTGENGSGKFWPKGTPFTGKARRPGVTKVQVTVNLDAGTCRFTFQGKAGNKGASIQFKVPELRELHSGNTPRLLYPAVSFYKSWGRVSLCPIPL